MTEIDAARVPPQALDSEQAVLGSLLLVPQAFEAIDWLRESDFYSSAHRVIFAAIERLVDRGRGVDVLLVIDELGANLEQAGGRGYVGGLASNTPSAAGIVRHAEIIRDRARLRALITHAADVLERAYEYNADAREISENAETAFLSVLDDRSPQEVSFVEALHRAVDQRDTPVGVISTGLANLDHMLKGGGMRPGQLIVIAGRPSMGKSALAWNIAEHVAARSHVLGFSLEMEAEELADRSLEYHARLTDRSAALAHLSDLHMTLDCTAAVSVSHIRMKGRRTKRRHGLGLIVVDYLQLMESKADNREQEIAKISRGLKAIAKELKVPVIAVAQLNRSVEGRADKRPMMADLRESGAVEQDADVVLMLYRDDYYNEQSQAPGIAEALFRKQRGGRTGTAYLKFTPDTTRFHDYGGPPPIYGEAKAGKVFDFKSRQAGD